jgi:hypothetical protein
MGLAGGIKIHGVDLKDVVKLHSPQWLNSHGNPFIRLGDYETNFMSVFSGGVTVTFI